MGKGIDYGMGLHNIDKETGIRFGVIPAALVLDVWSTESTAEISPTCADCGEDAVAWEDAAPELTNGLSKDEFVCPRCCKSFDAADAFGDPDGFSVCDDAYSAFQSADDTDIFVMRSPYYTRVVFCSPCAPGAGYLPEPCDDGEKTYCFDPDWFIPLGDDDVTGVYCGHKTSCPYPVYRVADDVCVFTPERRRS